jgi:PAS domain-containing protein
VTVSPSSVAAQMIPSRVIVVKTDALEVNRLEEALRQEDCEIVFERVETPESFLRAIDRQPWDAVIAGYELPQINAALILELLEQRGLPVPVIVVDEPIGESNAVALAKAGMCDFVPSSDIPRLAKAIFRETTRARISPLPRPTAVAQTAKRFHLPLAAARIDLWEWDLASGRISWSDSGHPSLGLPPGCFVSTVDDLRKVIHPADRYVLNQAGLLATETGSPDASFELELRIVQSEHSPGWWHSTYSVLRDRDGRPLRLLGVAQDITERKQAEECLRLAEQKFNVVFRRSPAVLCLSTFVGGRILDVNDAFTHNLGYMREEVVGRTEEDINLWAECDFRPRIIDRLATSPALDDVPANLWHKSGAALTGLCSFASVQVGIQRCLLTASVNLIEKELEGLSWMGTPPSFSAPDGH